MTEKYYDPHISEFHIGFEFEYLIDNIKDIWIPVTLGYHTDHAYSSIENVVPGIKRIPERFRVKYLDKKDIKSLGWKYRMGDYWAENGGEKYNLRSIKNDPDVYWTISIENEQYGNRLTFKIKNKSELKKIMQQLNIFIK